MRAGLFKHLAVGHDGAGQVGEVALAEERQRQHAQPLREGQAALFALFICCEIGIIILEPCGDENEREADGAAAHIERRSSGRSAAHQIADEIIEHTRRSILEKIFHYFQSLFHGFGNSILINALFTCDFSKTLIVVEMLNNTRPLFLRQ